MGARVHPPIALLPPNSTRFIPILVLGRGRFPRADLEEEDQTSPHLVVSKGNLSMASTLTLEIGSFLMVGLEVED